MKGSLSFDELRRELDDMRAQGLEPIPKLNFSSAHDQWLKEYHFMTSSPRYHEVVADLIRDVCDVFDRPRYFHIGFDEETFAAVEGRQLMVVRQGDLWWRDFLRIVNEVESHGARAMAWSDKICSGREEFLRRMPKSVLQVPWYYWPDFSPEKLKWRKELETRKDWTVQDNLAASLSVLAVAGYDMMPCTSNYYVPDATDAMIGYCRQAIDPIRIKGFLTCPWARSIQHEDAHIRKGIRLLADARRHYFGTAPK